MGQAIQGMYPRPVGFIRTYRADGYDFADCEDGSKFILWNGEWVDACPSQWE